jgi:hypothetical protein
MDASAGILEYCEDPSYTLVSTPADIDAIFGITGDYACEKVIRTFQDPSLSCPSNFTVYATNYCERPKTQLPVFECAKGFIMVNNQCEGMASISEPPIYTCAAGYQKLANKCVSSQTTSASVSCSEPFAVLQAGGCYLTTVASVVPAIEHCSNGSAPSGGVCTGYSQTLPDFSCPDATWSLNAFYGTCTKYTTTTLAATYSCADASHTLSGNTCTIETTHTPEYGCPTIAWVLDGSTCRREYTETKPADVCDTGDLFRFGQCYTPSYHAFVEGCRPGQVYNSTTNMCEYSSLSIQNPVVTCPTAGFTPYGNQCIKTTVQPVIKTCSNANYTLIGSVCYEEVVTAGTPIYGCPDGYTDNGTNCDYEDIVPADIGCDITHIYNASTDMCEAPYQDKKPAQNICPPGYSKKDEFTCTLVMATAPPTYLCNGAGQLSGQYCHTRHDTVVGQGYCVPPRYENAGQCELTKREAYRWSCPAGTEVRPDGCYLVTRTTQVPNTVCKP